MFIKEPIITEKSLAAAQKSNQYTFDVALKANKTAAARELEKTFNVKVTNVQVVNRLGKEVRFGSRRLSTGRRSDRKIMIFTLKAGDSIEAFKA